MLHKISTFAFTLFCISCTFGNTKQNLHNRRDKVFISNSVTAYARPESAYGIIKESVTALEIPIVNKPISSHILERDGYVISYNSDTRNCNWVAYELTREEANGEVPRDNNFYEDIDVDIPRATKEDYKGSGWSRGHMAPAGDMKWSEQAMRESCYLTNVCPQDVSLNDGAWRKLEELCRRLTDKYGKIWICCGPVFYTNTYRTIGTNGVAVPDAFFKVLLVRTADGTYQSVGFVFKNNGDRQPLADCSMSVDDVERITGLDFYPSLPNRVEHKVESIFNLRCWNLL